MLKKYKNGFIDVIQENNFDVNLFETNESDDGRLFYLKIKNSPHEFATLQSPDNFHLFKFRHTEFKPQFPKTEWEPYAYLNSSIEEIYKIFSRWLNHDVNEYLNDINVPEIWEQVELQKSIIEAGIVSGQDKNAFKTDEKQQIRLAIYEYKLLIFKTFSPSDEEQNIIINRLDYLSESIDRLNKIDWNGLAISTIISIYIALSLDTEKGKILFNLFKSVVVNTIRVTQ